MSKPESYAVLMPIADELFECDRPFCRIGA